MRVLFFPYLVFKDMHQASGVIHQAEMIRALSVAGCSVTVLWPSNKDGWKYDTSPFDGLDNVCVHRVEFLKDQDTVAGRFSDELIKALRPEWSPLVFDVVLSGVPGAALGMKRWLTQTGFSRLQPALVNFFDIVTVPEERAIRGGYSEGFATEMALLECAGATRSASILPRQSEASALTAQLRKFLAPSQVVDAMSRVRVVPRPFYPPQGVKHRKWEPGTKFEVFSARSFGPSAEEGGEQVTPILDAIQNLRVLGHDITMRLYTRSQGEWVDAQQQKYGEALDLRPLRPRNEVLQGLYDCPASADMRDYCGLYMSSIEAVCSGSPHLYKASKWIENEVDGLLEVPTWSVDEITATLKWLMKDYEFHAQIAYEQGVEGAQKRSPENVGSVLKAIMQAEVNRLNPKFDPKTFKSMLPLFADWPDSEMSLDQALDLIESRMESGKLGRYSLAWVARMLASVGAEVVLTGGADDPKWVVRKG